MTHSHDYCPICSTRTRVFSAPLTPVRLESTLLFKSTSDTLTINHSINTWACSYLDSLSAQLCSQISDLCRPTEASSAEPRAEIRAISCHRRIRKLEPQHRPLPTCEQMWRCLQLHCRPNDLDGWVEALGGSQSLYCLHVLGGNVQYWGWTSSDKQAWMV